MTSSKFRSALRELVIVTFQDWLGAARCRLFGRHTWDVLGILEMPCGASDITIVCFRCEAVAVTQHHCGDDDEGVGRPLPKPAEHLRVATQPARGGVVELPAAIGTLPEAASQGSAVRAEGKVVGLSAVRAVGLSGIEEAPPPSAAAQAAAAYAVRAKEASAAHAANIARSMDPTVASLLWEQALLAAREALHYSPPTDPDNSMLEAGIAALQDAISNAQTGRVADHDPRDSGADASRCPSCGQLRRH